MEKYFLIYLCVINILAAVITIYDKIAAKRLPRRRIPEKSLIILAFLGGSVGELLAMRIIRHKTKHKKFMVGIPVIIFLQLAVIIVIILFDKGIISL